MAQEANAWAVSGACRIPCGSASRSRQRGASRVLQDKSMRKTPGNSYGYADVGR